MAKFTNHGPEIDLVGPGVGVISLFPRNRLADMCGTSMAAPAMTGCLARALAREAALLSRARDQTRSDAIVKLALQTATSLGFPVAYQGRGLLGTVA
jgi:minor extracellular protease Epr